MAAVAPGARMQAPHARNDVATAPGRPAPAGAPPQNTPPHSVGSSAASPSSSGPTSPQMVHSTVALPTRVAHDPQQRPVQIGRPKPSGFVPAALRPTERPQPAQQKQDGKGQQRGHRASQSRSGPPTPPHSLYGSTDSLANAHVSSRTSSTSPPSNGSGATLTKTASNSSAARPASIDTTNTNVRSLSSRAASTLSSPTASLSSLSLTGMASAAAMAPHPTKAHWKPDAMATTCDAAACPAIFSTFTRRHHCRRCGGVFCHRHASRQVLLDGDARMVATPALSTTDSASVPGTPFAGSATATASPSSGSTIGPNTTVSWSGSDDTATPDTAAATAAAAAAGDDGLLMRTDVGLWRACDSCHAEWTNWTEGLREAAENAKNGSGGLGSYLQMPIGLGVPGAERKSSIVGSIAGSVPRDWSWSTF